MKRVILTAAILTVFSSGIYAQKYPKFDQGVNLSDFLKAAAETSSLQVPSLLPEPITITVKTCNFNDMRLSGKWSPLPPNPGYFLGRFGRYVDGNTAYKYAEKYPPLLQPIQDPAAQLLLKDWDKINIGKGLLLGRASTLDNTDSGIYKRGIALNQEAAALNEEIDRYNADLAKYKKECTNVVSEKCTNWNNDLHKWHDGLVDRINKHNQAVANLKVEYNTFMASASTWFDDLTAWEQFILTFIEKAEALAHDTGNCTYDEWEPLQKAVDTYCHGVEFHCGQWNPTNPILDCPTWRLFLAKGLACYDARHNINTKCYNGGNPTHTEAENNAIKAIANCQKLINQFCWNSCGPIIPVRRYGLGF
ncbi:MAG: hypothetical protein HY796_04405 [Elusimicrobia bacterium]|nr:hypothetical protein [Elusimicrobiota bacterium]